MWKPLVQPPARQDYYPYQTPHKTDGVRDVEPHALAADVYSEDLARFARAVSALGVQFREVQRHALGVLTRRKSLLGAFAAFAGPVIPARSDTAPVESIQQLADGLIQIMKAGSATPFPARFDMLAPLVDRVFDLDVVLRTSVGSAWVSLPPSQQDLLRPAFRRYTIASYVNSFDHFNGQRFSVEPQTQPLGNDEQIVRTRIIPPSGDGHELDYVMRNTGSGWRAVDVLADGTISRVAVQRSDFRRLLSRGGAPALAESLATKSLGLSDGMS